MPDKLLQSVESEWWANRIYLLQMRKNLSREEVRKAWSLLWDEWAKLEPRYLDSRFLPEKVRMVLAFRKVNPLAFMLAPTFLVGLTSKGMTADELSGLVDSFHDHGWFREYDSHELPDPDTIYSNGFGGDAIRTINVSTSAMVIAAATGVPCYKMGSRTYFSHSGSHNFLDLVGVKASTTPEHALSTLKKIGLAYIDGVATADGPTQGIGKGLSMMPGANKLMKAMSYPFRFPILCLNPLKPKISIRGVSTLDTEVPAQVLKSYYSYTRRFEVVAGTSTDGAIIDEVSNVGPTKVTEFRDGELRTFTTSPEDWGVKQAHPRDIHCGEPWVAGVKTIGILRGFCNDAHKDLLLINAGHFIYLAGKAKTRREGTEMARAAVDDGRALDKLRQWVEVSDGERGVFELIVAAAGREDAAQQMRHPLKLGTSAG
jgi:anthranilate phosphoribosyltransferase